MKKSILIPVILLVAHMAQAQFYSRIGISYAAAQASQTIDGSGLPYSGSITNGSTQNLKLKGASFSAGGYATIGAGYMFTDHIGAQLDALIGIAPAFYTLADDNQIIQSLPYDLRVEQRANMPLFAVPSLVIQSGGNTWNFYSRFGIALPLYTDITQDQIFSNPPGTGKVVVDDITISIKNSFSVGYSAAAGLTYRLNDHVSVFGEVNMLSMSLYIKRSEIIDLREDGVSYSLSNISSPLVTNYSRSAVVDSTGTVQPAYSMPFSNVGFHVGLCYAIPRSHKASGRKSEPVRKPATRRR